jgi:hypothetical protein
MSNIIFYADLFTYTLNVALLILFVFILFWLIRRLKIGLKELKIPLLMSIVLSILTSTYEYFKLTNSIIQQSLIYKTMAVLSFTAASFGAVFVLYIIIRQIIFLHNAKKQYGGKKRNIELDCSTKDVFEAFRKFSMLKFEVSSLDQTNGIIILKTSISDWSLGEILNLTVTPSAKGCNVDIEAKRKLPTNISADLYTPVDKVVHYLRDTLEKKKLTV